MNIDRVLTERFGLTSFRDGQRAVIDALLKERAALAVFPTGGGKSLCYQLPALLLDGLTVVISPLIALMKDQIDFLRERGVAAARLDSSLSSAEARDVSRKIRAGELKLLYVAPERFNNERFLDQMAQVKIALFAVDEAHCISEWGHNFRPDYLKLAETARALKVERVLTLTATATPPVVQDICDSFGIPQSAAVITGFHRPNLLLRTSPTAPEHRDEALIDRLTRNPTGSGIVYVTLQRTAVRVAEALTGAGITARPYHAGMTDEERVEVQEWWKASSGSVVVATIAFGMGIDKADVRYVYHYNLPKSLESYSQEIGRAGRDGKSSVVEALGDLEDVAALENFAHGDTPTREALTGMLGEVLALPQNFDVGYYDLSSRYDIRQLVLRTALTYLELSGVLRQLTPFYGEYRVKPLEPLEGITARFPGERGNFLRQVFGAASKGTTWYTLDADAIAARLRQDRNRILRALDHLSEQGLIELQPSGVRQRYRRLIESPDVAALVDDLNERFRRRETLDVDRVRQVVGLVTYDGCQTNALLEHFGEMRPENCGHCSFCETGLAAVMPPIAPRPPISEAVDAAEFRSLVVSHRGAIGLPRQQARFLCGLSSPALTRAKLTRHPMFGALQRHRFAEILDWCSATP